MRVSRDQRGYETTYLLHTPRPGERPRVLYWYRTAPGVRVGRRALDEDAIRTLEEQFPDIEFDWPALLEEAESIEPEVERRPERPRRRRASAPVEDASGRVEQSRGAEGGERAERRASAPFDEASRRPEQSREAEGPEGVERRASAPVDEGSARPEQGRGAEGADAEKRTSAQAVGGPSSPRAAGVPRNALLEQLVGREIASRLRARYIEVSAKLAELPEDEKRAAWQRRADALDPDRWSSAEAILEGIRHADGSFDELKRELP